MLARERSTIANHKIGCTVDELCVFPDPVFAFKIEADAHVDAAMSKMAIECASVAVFVHQLADVPQIAPQLFGSHGGVVPAFPLRRCAGSKGGRARPSLAYLPHGTRFAFRVQPRVRCFANLFQPIDELHGKMLRLVRIIGAEFHQQIPAPLGKEIQVWRSLPLEPVDYTSFKTFQSDRMELQYFRNMIGCEERISISQSNERAMLWTVNQFQLSFQYDCTSAFCSDECACEVESFFRQQFIQVVAGDSSRNLRKARANQAGVVLLNPMQLAVYLATAATLRNDVSELRPASSAHRHLRAVVKQNSQLFDVVDRFPSEQRMRSARIISDHPADRAPIMRSRSR